jgi:hypothetical protein
MAAKAESKQKKDRDDNSDSDEEVNDGPATPAFAGREVVKFIKVRILSYFPQDMSTLD